jgi:hypothetical protein
VYAFGIYLYKRKRKGQSEVRGNKEEKKEERLIERKGKKLRRVEINKKRIKGSRDQ